MYLIAAELLQTNVGVTLPWVVGPAWVAGSSNPIYPSPEKAIGLIATVVSGSPAYSIQVTADINPSPTGYWNDHADASNINVSVNTNIFYPVTGIRLSVNSGTGVVHLGMCRWA